MSQVEGNDGGLFQGKELIRFGAVTALELAWDQSWTEDIFVTVWDVGQLESSTSSSPSQPPSTTTTCSL